MRSSRWIPIALSALVMAAAVAEPAHARRPQSGAYTHAPPPNVPNQLVSMTIERPGAGTMPGFFHGGSMYYAGNPGDHYALRFTNNTAGRVEVVITVDGRDVISGEVGNYKKQRGYVIEPFATVVVDGFRQSLDQVAAFQFAGLEDSYTAQMGTPQFAGVIGVAIFEENQRSARRHRKRALAAAPPQPVYQPYYRGSSGHSVPDAFPDSPSKSARESEASADEAPAAATGRAEGGGFAPVPEPTQHLGTAYGESRYSSVREVPFKRHRKRKPDGFLTVYYDTMQALQNRGVDVHQPQYYPEPQPFVQPGFAAPPPRWR